MTFVSGVTTVTLNGAIYPFTYTLDRHQSVGISGDGTARVYDRGPTEQYIGIQLRDDHSNLTNIRSFIETTLVFRKNTFTFTPDSGVDVGNGDGGAVTVRYWGGTFMESQNFYHGYYYDIILRVE